MSGFGIAILLDRFRNCVDERIELAVLSDMVRSVPDNACCRLKKEECGVFVREIWNVCDIARIVTPQDFSHGERVMEFLAGNW